MAACLSRCVVHASAKGVRLRQCHPPTVKIGANVSLVAENLDTHLPLVLPFMHLPLNRPFMPFKLETRLKSCARGSAQVRWSASYKNRERGKFEKSGMMP